MKQFKVMQKNFPLQTGKIIACYLDEYKEELQIGKILEVKLTVNWMSGSYSYPWHPCNVRGIHGQKTFLKEVLFVRCSYPVVTGW